MSDKTDFDLEPWEPQSPPRGFADKVMAELPAPTPRAWWRSRRFTGIAAGTALSLAAAAGAFLWLSAANVRGSLESTARTEVDVGGRARAVVESGAKLSWKSNEVEQIEGDVFYRVEPSGPFVVKTPQGTVEVTGTCFRVRIKERGASMKRELLAGAAGAAASALVMVGVYEGGVRVTHAGEAVTLAAGEAVVVGEDGVEEKGDLAEVDSQFNRAKSARVGSDSGALAGQVKDLTARITELDNKKKGLEDKLKFAENKLSALEGGTDAKKLDHDEFDLDENDWRELAKDGTIKYQVPCIRDEAWRPDADDLDKIGLAPDDADAIGAAYARSSERVKKAILPICAEMVGGAELADLIGPGDCAHVISSLARRQDKDAAEQARLHVSEIRAGLRPAPAPTDKVHPVLATFLALTGEASQFEADLATEFGPEEAKRITYAEGMCMSHSTWGGSPPRK